MSYRAKRTWKDFVEGPRHQALSRRDFLKRGLATGAMAVVLPEMFGVEWLRQANAGTLSCTTPMKNPGAIAQLYASGGPTMGARFFSEAQAAAMNSTMAGNYGISGTSLLKLGPGVVIDTTSVFGMTLLQGPAGFPSTGYANSAAAWQALVLSKISAGGHLGPFNADDGAGLNSGLLGSVSLDRATLLGRDVNFYPGPSRAVWTNGTPAVSVGTASPANLEVPFTLTPAAAGNTSSAEMTNAANGAIAIAQALSPVLGTATRKGGSNMMNSAGCAFYGNSAITNPSFAPGLFDPTNIAGLTGAMTVASLSAQEQALASAFYQSATGVIGGVTVQLGGRDYHGLDPATAIAPIDIEDARTVVMFLASCYAAQQPGAFIYVSNGQAIANGVQSVTATVNGAPLTMNCPVAMGDAAGHYNGGLILFYSPTGSVPTARYSGTLNSSSGDVTMDPNVGSAQNAIGGLFMTAHKFISGTVPNSLMTRMQTAGLATIPNNLILI